MSHKQALGSTYSHHWTIPLLTFALPALVIVGFVGAAEARGALIRIDANQFAASRNPSGQAFDDDYTGEIALTEDSDSEIRDFSTGTANNLQSQIGQLTEQIQSFDLNISLINGHVTGGSLSLILTDNDTYTATLQDGAGDVGVRQDVTAQVFTVDALTQGGSFLDADEDQRFGGVPIDSRFFDSDSTVDGSLISFKYNGASQDASVDLDFAAQVAPEPTSLAMVGTLVGVAGILTRPRRAVRQAL